MAEGGRLEGVFGEESEGRETDPGAPGVDPFAAAAALNHAPHEPELARATGAYLDKQGRLVELQLKHFDEEHRLAIEAARRKRYSDRIRNMLASFAAAAVAIVGLFVVTMGWAAANDHGLVVEAFRTPPDLAQRGLGGEVLAGQVLDKLAVMEAASRNPRDPVRYQDNWDSHAKVEIPETGVSLNELDDFLREQFGHQTRITGEVWRSPAGVTVTVRAGDAHAKSFSGAEGDLEILLQQAAEAVYADTQPYAYGLYLDRNGRFSEALVVLRDLADNGPISERAWAYCGLAWTHAYMGRSDLAIDELREAIRRDPDMLVAYNNAAANAAIDLGREEEGLQFARAGLARLNQRALGRLTPLERTAVPLQLTYLAAAYYGDVKAGVEAAEKAIELGGPAAIEGRAYGAVILAEGHDVTRARAMLDRAQIEDEPARDIVTRLWIEKQARNWPAVLALTARYDGLIQTNDPEATFARASALTLIWPEKAEALANTGDPAGARTLIAQTPLDCSPCLRGRAAVADATGDPAGAAHWFALAEQVTPSDPSPVYQWANMLLRRGDLSGALVKAQQAHAMSPRSPDALEVWGEILLAQDKPEEALNRLRQAETVSLPWGRLHIMLGEALAKLGRTAEARDQWRSARGMDLTPEERAQFAHLLTSA
jgi:tetratricopeptide (TPR) repeat protein